MNLWLEFPPHAGPVAVRLDSAAEVYEPVVQYTHQLFADSVRRPWRGREHGLPASYWVIRTKVESYFTVETLLRPCLICCNSIGDTATGT